MSGLDDVHVGVDIQEIAAFERWNEDDERRFLERVFTAGERAWCADRPRPAQHFAARFAAKEAVVKALSGRLELALEEVEILRDEDGRPRARLLCDGAEGFALKISLSHSDTQAVAVALAEECER